MPRADRPRHPTLRSRLAPFLPRHPPCRIYYREGEPLPPSILNPHIRREAR
jgi:hypothetical protein